MKKRAKKATPEQIAAIKAALAKIFWFPGKGAVVKETPDG